LKERSTGLWMQRTSSGWLRAKATEQKATSDSQRILGAAVAPIALGNPKHGAVCVRRAEVLTADQESALREVYPLR
jgi:hypothetical protein